MRSELTRRRWENWPCGDGDRGNKILISAWCGQVPAGRALCLEWGREAEAWPYRASWPLEEPGPFGGPKQNWEPSQWTAYGHDLIYHLKGLFWLLKVSFFLLVFYEDQCKRSCFISSDYCVSFAYQQPQIECLWNSKWQGEKKVFERGSPFSFCHTYGFPTDDPTIPALMLLWWQGTFETDVVQIKTGTLLRWPIMLPSYNRVLCFCQDFPHPPKKKKKRWVLALDFFLLLPWSR